MTGRDSRLLLLVAVLATAAVTSAYPSTAGDASAGRFDALVQAGMQDIAPAEMAIARELLAQSAAAEPGAVATVELQLELLDRILEAHRLELQADELERKAIETETGVKAETAAYDFLVEQMLASGVASYWSGP